MKRGDRVELLTHWAYDTDPAWFKGYVFDHAEAGDTVIVLHADGPFEGAPVRKLRTQVRLAP